MNSKHRKTLTEIFDNPLRVSILWADIEKLFVALGAEIIEGRGSRVRVDLNGELATFHRPYPRPITDRGAVKSVREYLVRAGVKP